MSVWRRAVARPYISWACPRFRELRAPALAALPKPLRCLPKCFKRTTVVPANFVIAPAALHAIQTALVNIWQQHIQEWSSAEELATVVVPPSAQSPAAAEVPVEKRGHVLRPTPARGVFCCKCGRQTQYVKHVRLKITKTVCPNASLPPDRWLTSPGRMVATSRLDDLFRQTQTQLNRNIHGLAWNRKSGKDAADASTFGLLYCRGCGRTWPWMRRHQAFKNTVCNPPPSLPTPPTWVSCTQRRTAQASLREPLVVNAQQRVRRKAPHPSHAVSPDAHDSAAAPASVHLSQRTAAPVALRHFRELPSSSNELPWMGVG